MADVIKLNTGIQAYQCPCGGTTFMLVAVTPGQVFDGFICSECGRENAFGELDFKTLQIFTWFASQAIKTEESLPELLRAAAAHPDVSDKRRKKYTTLINICSDNPSVERTGNSPGRSL